MTIFFVNKIKDGFTLKQNFYSLCLQELSADDVKSKFHLEIFLEQ